MTFDFSKKTMPFRQEAALFLTYIRTSQQTNIGEIIKKARNKLKGKTFIVRQNPPRFCKQNSIAFLTQKDGKVVRADLKKIKCNSWTCPDCNIGKAIKVKYLLREVIIKNNLEQFLTLTLDPKTIPHEYLSLANNNTHKYITKIFNAFLVNLKRDKVFKQEKIKYVWVIEFQKNGNAHMHILFNRLPYVKKVRRIWMRVGGGVSMKIIKIKTMVGISNYIGNYIVKGIKGDKTSKNTFKFFEKRYSISRSCIRPSSSLSEFLPNVSLQEKLNALQSGNLGDVVYSLVMGEEKSFDL